MLKPNAAIRRFDVFAEFNRQKAIKEGMSASQAKGYGLWLAKVVAARRFGTRAKPQTDGEHSDEARERRRSKWRALDGKPQTDKLFDKEIVARMGAEFYRKEFVPAIRRALKDGQDYTEIRDSVREHWQ